MREIKFKAYEKNLGEIIPVHEIDFENNVINSNSAWRTFSEIELIQYTGLKDKNGKEIYYGDICLYDRNINDRTDKKTFVVDYQDGSFFLDEWAEQIHLHDIDETQELVEVIGNIYEHPHLLEGNK